MNISRRYISIGVDVRPMRGSNNRTNGAKNAGSSKATSTRASSSGSRRTYSGSSDSHNDS